MIGVDVMHICRCNCVWLFMCAGTCVALGSFAVVLGGDVVCACICVVSQVGDFPVCFWLLALQLSRSHSCVDGLG